MDERKEQLKVLKKAYHKKKARMLGIWKWLFALSIFFAAVLLGLRYAPVWVLLYLPAVITEKIVTPLFSQISWLATIILGVIFVLSIIGWAVNGKRLKKTEAFFNYRTMDSALKMEKKLQR